MVAGPRVNFDPANLAAETAGTPGWVLLPCRAVRQPAIGTAEIFGGPYVACHPAIMRRIERIFQLSAFP